MAKSIALKRKAKLIELAALFKMGGHPVRVTALVALQEADKGIEALHSLCPDIGPMAVGHHLRLLHVGSAIEARREGMHVVYSLTSKGQLLLKAIEAIG